MQWVGLYEKFQIQTNFDMTNQRDKYENVRRNVEKKTERCKFDEFFKRKSFSIKTMMIIMMMWFMAMAWR